MEILLIAFIWVLNFGISWWNAYAVGKCWAEARTAGGYMRFMTWVGAAMSAAGFTWCYIIAEAAIGAGTGLLSASSVGLLLSLGYVLLVPIILFASYAITFDSWARAFREGGVLNYGVAAYNSYATYHNTVSAISGFGQAFGSVLDAFSGKGSSSSSSSSSSDDAGGILVAIGIAILVIITIGGGILTTMLIVKKSAASEPLLSRAEMERRRAAAQ